jgi:hypothetical protein
MVNEYILPWEVLGKGNSFDVYSQHLSSQELGDLHQSYVASAQASDGRGKAVLTRVAGQ